MIDLGPLHTPEHYLMTWDQDPINGEDIMTEQPKTKVYDWTLYVANSDSQYLATIAQDLGLSGTSHSRAWGFGAWGVEPTVVLEVGTATDQDIRHLIYDIFQYESNEEEIYVVRSDGLRKGWKRVDNLFRPTAIEEVFLDSHLGPIETPAPAPAPAPVCDTEEGCDEAY